MAKIRKTLLDKERMNSFPEKKFTIAIVAGKEEY